MAASVCATFGGSGVSAAGIGVALSGDAAAVGVLLLGTMLLDAVMLGATAQAPNKSVSPKQLAAKNCRPASGQDGQEEDVWLSQAVVKIYFSRCVALQSG